MVTNIKYQGKKFKTLLGLIRYVKKETIKSRDYEWLSELEVDDKDSEGRPIESLEDLHRADYGEN